jgi:hypothetical protein
MSRQLTILLGILTVILGLACLFAYRMTNHAKTHLEIADVQSATIFDVASRTEVKLNQAKIIKFVTMWNAAVPMGYNKLNEFYIVRLQMTNGERLRFGTSGEWILEGSTNGWVYSVRDTLIFQDLLAP